ncbi:MAG: histidinol dehydrogenase [Tunicatimonas sp.]
MKVVNNPPPSVWKELLERPTQKFKQTKKIVSPILKKVKKRGDRALRQFSLEYDHVELNELAVSEAEIQSAREQVSPALRNAIQVAKENIEKFHQAQRTEPISVETMPGVRCERRSVPIERVGLYIPGGTAPLFSSVLMLGVPAALAGCREVILCTPPNRRGRVHPAILYTADLVGIRKIFRVGGAQAVAAMAYGTESIPAVYKIAGPGNQYVTVAKQLVSQHGVAIDIPAGSSEVAVLADASANPTFVAADLLSQAEHGVDSQVVLVSTSADLVERVQEALREQLADLPRRTIAEQALEGSVALVVPDLTTAYDLLNEYGAEHLIIATANPRDAVEHIINAGSVFLGHYTPESAGDYASGTNHTLPTNGMAKAYSGVSLDTFVKKITYQEISPEGLQRLGPLVATMAEAEELVAHQRAVTLRLEALNR